MDQVEIFKALSNVEKAILFSSLKTKIKDMSLV